MRVRKRNKTNLFCALPGEFCGREGVNSSRIRFSWEVAPPATGAGSRTPFQRLTDATLFTGVEEKLLDSVYFASRFAEFLGNEMSTRHDDDDAKTIMTMTMTTTAMNII